MNSKTTCTKEITISKKELKEKFGIEGKIEDIRVLTDSWGLGVSNIIVITKVSEKRNEN